MRAIENMRAAEAERQYDLIIAQMLQATRGVTNPLQIQAIVSSYMQKYQGVFAEKTIIDVVETMQKSTVRADMLLKLGGIKPPNQMAVKVPARLRDSLTVNVKNQIDTLTAATKAKVTRLLIDGANTGDSPRSIANKISEATDIEKNRAIMIARTETIRAHVETSVDRFRQLGIQQVEWLTAHDQGLDRVCDVCKEFDGKTYSIDDHPDCPQHPNCRCVLLPVFEGGA